MRILHSVFILTVLIYRTDSKIPSRFTSRSINLDLNAQNFQKQFENNQTIIYRLPNNTYPLHYDIHLTTHVHESIFEFEGHVTIKFTVKSAPLNKITLHVNGLLNIKIKLLDINRNTVENDLIFDIDKATDFLTIKPLNNLVINQNYYLDFYFDGVLRDDNLGFYKSSYVNTLNDTVWLATSQFESVEARSAFPCWDEPNIRTPFKIRISHGENYRAISNMPEKTPIQSAIPGYVTTAFEESFPIQTYAVAFIVSDFKNVIDSSKFITQRIFAKPQSIKSGEAIAALTYGQEVLGKLGDYLDIPYFGGFLSKMDQFALPDFDAGAMENFGLVTYREEYLLHNNLIDTTKQKENVLTVIAHEFAHMYFGNLVSPQWWSYLWLNEGFATLYEFYIASLLYDSERLMDSFNLNILQPALQHDVVSTRPMSFYVENPDDIGNLFDWVSYEKSGSVLRMIQNAIGDETWRKGLKYYLNERLFKEATPNDLHANLQRAMNEDGLEALDIASVMLSWETQSGYPLITVDTSDGNLTFSQDRFQYNRPENLSAKPLWHVPINYITSSDTMITATKADLWMSQQKLTLTRETAPKYWHDDDWIVVNLQQGYYYRVNYNNDMWMLLVNQLNNCFDKIDVRNRGQLIDDSFHLARGGLISYDIPFGIVKYLRNEVDYVAWQSAYKNILFINRLLSGLDMHNKYQKFIRRVVEPFYRRIGSSVIENEHKFKRYSRTIAFNLACRFGSDLCLKQTKYQIKEALIHPDLQEAIYSNGLKDADEEIYDRIIEKMISTKHQAEKSLLIRALASSENDDLLEDLLELAMTNETLRRQERQKIMLEVSKAGAVGAEISMEFIEENYKKINRISSTLIRSMLSNIAPLISSDDPIKQFNQLLDFLLGKEVINKKYKASALEIVDSTKEWQNKYAKKIEEWLDNNGSSQVVISMAVVALAATLNIFLLV